MSDMPPDPFPPVARTGLGGMPAHITDAAGHTVLVNVEAIPLNLDGPDMAEWCDSCLLPSALGYRFRLLANGVALPSTLHITVCRDCGHYARRMT